jgi:MAF protein
MLSLLLASSSTYRCRQLKQLKIDFKQLSPNIPEHSKAEENAVELATRLATQKANAVLTLIDTPSLIIGCDQVAECNGTKLGKPGTVKNAQAQLQLCAGETVYFHSAICLLNSQTLESQVSVETTEVKFKPLTATQIARYIELEPALDCAGSFKVEGLGITLFESIKADDPNSLIGLPLIKLTDMLRNEGIDPLAS